MPVEDKFLGGQVFTENILMKMEHTWIGWLLVTVKTKEKDNDELRALNSQIKVYIRNLEASRLAL